MGDKATLRLARQELEDLYLGVPDDSVDLTFKDLASSSLPATATTVSKLSTVDEGDALDEHKMTKQTTGGALARSSTNIFTYRPLEAGHYDAGGALGAGGGALLQLPNSPAAAVPPTTARFVPQPHHHRDDDDDDYDDRQHHYYAGAAAAAGTTAGEAHRSRRTHVADDDTAGGGGRRERRSSNYKRPGIPHSNMCALCNNYVYLFRHRCLVCGRVYCRRCVGAGMGDMTEGRKCVDCLGRRYSHRYIHRAGDAAGGCGGFLCCFWGYYPDAKAVTAQELIWAEKGPAPRRRPPRHAAGGMSSASYGGSGYYSSTNTVNSASMSSIIMNHSDNSIAMMKMNVGGHHHAMPTSASSSFVAAFPHNPHALPL
ncbi:unnamed protein product [Urochloa humidicola]